MSAEEYCKKLYEHLGQPSEIIIKADRPPGYISNLKITNQLSPIILIFKEDKQNENGTIVKVPTSEPSNLENSIADLSLTGQPLECPFDMDETLNITDHIEPVVFSEEYYHAPLSLLDARKYLGIMNIEMVPPIPVWALTDMNEREKTFLLGTDIKDGWRKRIWAIAHGSRVEKVPIKNMLEDFEKLFRIGSGFKVTTSVCCVFNMKDEPGMLKNSNCFLEAIWRTPSYEVPVAQADTSLIIECTVGQEESQISRWWQQLNLLEKYINIIKQRRQAQQVQLTYQRDSIQLPFFKTDPETVTKKPLSERVLDLLQRSDSMSVCRQLGTNLNTTSALNSTIHELLADKQKGQDFTDRLWSLLIEAETYQELAECFQLVIREVRKQPIKPYIFVKNRTRLASLLRSIKSNNTNVELMLEPLELMVEMGLEKLKRDYMFMFLASHITTEDALCIPKLPSFMGIGAAEWQTTVDTWLQWLAQLHTVLEVVSVVHTTMPPTILVQVTGLALTTFLGPQSPVQSLQGLIDQRTYQLRVPVIAKEVKNFIEGERPFYKWILKLTGATKYREVTSSYVLLEHSPFPKKILMKLMEGEEDLSSLNDTALLTQTILQTSSTFQEKYTYIQVNSAGDKMPY